MPLPTPEPGLVVSYSYLWDREAQGGQEEGQKDRPCVVALVLTRQQDRREPLVTILPVTHRAPDDAAAAVEIPPAVKKHLGLDDDRSWIVVSEGDRFVWPGYDLRKVRGSQRYDYGFLPPRFFERVMTAFLAWRQAHRTRLVSRE